MPIHEIKSSSDEVLILIALNSHDPYVLLPTSLLDGFRNTGGFVRCRSVPGCTGSLDILPPKKIIHEICRVGLEIFLKRPRLSVKRSWSSVSLRSSHAVPVRMASSLQVLTSPMHECAEHILPFATVKSVERNAHKPAHSKSMQANVVKP
jgi:hypothetical protein